MRIYIFSHQTFDDSDLEDSSDTHEHQGFDVMASSSCDSKAPATITSASQIMNFSNQFPTHSSSYPHILDEAATLNLHLDDLDNASDFVDVTNEIDVTGIDDTLECDENIKEPVLPTQDEVILQQEENSPNIEIEQETEIIETSKSEQEAIIEEIVTTEKDLNISKTVEEELQLQEEIPSAFIETEQAMQVDPPQQKEEENVEEKNLLPQLGIDPDDDMAGLMMELQKDNLLDSVSKNIDTSSL